MSKHIELVEKWLADPSSVSQAELKANYNAAALAATAAYNDTTATYNAATAAYYAANASDDAAYYAAYYANAAWAAKYHKEVKEQDHE